MSLDMCIFQRDVLHWMEATFPQYVITSKPERNHRFFEEATELVQANEMSRETAHRIVDYVFDRPVGEVPQEVANAMICLSALATQAGVTLDEAVKIELKRVWDNRDLIREKQARKPRDISLL